ncbi:MAG: LysE family translocator [Sphingobium sp.]|nr:LysE family translocator [Sphingobium sp.]
MALQTWWLYVTAVCLISSTPGPNMLHVMTSSVKHGLNRTPATMAGLLTAVFLCLLASAAGLGALLRAVPELFNMLRIAGAAYLIYLGWKAWRSPISAPDAEPGEPLRAPSPVALYRAGLLTGLSNPKLIIFAAALFPQFIDPQRPYGPQLAILVGSFAAIDTFWYLMYALGGARLAAWLKPVRRQRLFNRGTGAMFFGFGGLLLVRSN